MQFFVNTCTDFKTFRSKHICQNNPLYHMSTLTIHPEHATVNPRDIHVCADAGLDPDVRVLDAHRAHEAECEF